MGYEHLETEVIDHVGWLWLNRPEKRNALSEDMWADIPRAVDQLGSDPEVRVVVVAGRGPAFTVGIDLGMLMSVNRASGSSEAANKMAMFHKIRELQATMTSFERCPKPVIAAIHGWCLGAGVDLITACDIRLASSDAVFGVRETRLALVADVGTLQRLPKILSPGHVAELAFTGRDIDAGEAERIGLVNRLVDSPAALQGAAANLAAEIAANSPLVVQGVKAVLQAEEGMSTSAALDHVALWNTSFLMSNDLGEAMSAHLEKRPPTYDGT
ncbi:MAG: crotonase/enoyl-CoA hydratase family protein [Acidimicrobiia bacterium]|nr:crotonase/enoyl-CoA hydratase family protein [Acidimicrobiia bacterium]MDH4307445.1 crotonase/enoyl-CoA hydratase family protein [Acidimicrobiia bacterium]